MNATGNPIPKQQNIFFEKIKEAIAKKIADNTLVSDLKRVSAAFAADPESKLRQKDYELVGMMAYLNGLDYTSQVGGLTAPVMTNVVKRYTALEVPAEAIAYYQIFIKYFAPKVLEEPKDQTTNMVENIVPLHGQDLLTIRSAINLMLNYSTYPMQFALDIDTIKKKKTYTYQDFLKINSMIYEQLDLNGKHIKHLNRLYHNQKFVEALNTGSTYFDLSKFALIYYDSIFSVKEFQAINGYPDILPYYTDLDKIAELPDKYELPITDYVAPDPAEMAKAKYAPPLADENDTDTFIRSVIEERGGLRIGSAADFIACVEAVIEDQKLCGDVYKYLRANMQVRRSAVAGVYGEKLAVEIEDALALTAEEQRENYKDLVIRYTEVIPEDNAGRIVKYVNELIEASIIHGGERKSALMQQFFQNQITTYKHLNETIKLIEECKIDGGKSDAYVNLHDYLLNSWYPFVKLFEEVQSIDDIQLKLSVYQAFLDFLKVEVTEENSFAKFKEGNPAYTAKESATPNKPLMRAVPEIDSDLKQTKGKQ
jgi:hypothetical protein